MFFGSSATISALVRIPQATKGKCKSKIGLRQVVLPETATWVQGDTTLGRAILSFVLFASCQHMTQSHFVGILCAGLLTRALARVSISENYALPTPFKFQLRKGTWALHLARKTKSIRPCLE